MLNKETREFCEDNAISIRKFLSEYFDFIFEIEKDKKKHRIKHAEISCMALVNPVSLHFAMRYQDLVAMGKILVVKDEFGKYKCYINPRIMLIDPSHRENLEGELSKLRRPFNNILELESRIKRMKTISDQINSLEENERIIRHFNGEENLEYGAGMYDSFQVLKRK